MESRLQHGWKHLIVIRTGALVPCAVAPRSSRPVRATGVPLITVRRVLRAAGIALWGIVATWGGGSVAAGPEKQSDAAPAEERVLRIFNWADYIAPQLLEQFRARYGVRIEYSTYGSTEELFRAVLDNPGHHDIIVPTSYAVAQLRGKGMLATLDKSRIPNLRNLDPLFMSPTHDPGSRYCVAYLWSKLVVGYDKRRVSTPIRHWADLFDPRHRGRVALLADNRESIGIILLMLGYSPNTTNPVEITKARDFLLDHRSHIHSFADDTGQDLLIAGEADIVLEWEGDMVTAEQKHPHLAHAVPAEGSLLVTDSLCIARGAPHKATAERFIDFILDGANGAVLSRETRYPTPNRAAQALMTPAERQRLGMTDEMRHRLFPLTDVGTNVAVLYDEAWSRILERPAHRQRGTP